jgi:hypothetical protein
MHTINQYTLRDCKLTKFAVVNKHASKIKAEPISAVVKRLNNALEKKA